MKRMIRTIINLYHNVFVYLIEHVENCFRYLIGRLKSQKFLAPRVADFDTFFGHYIMIYL